MRIKKFSKLNKSNKTKLLIEKSKDQLLIKHQAKTVAREQQEL